MLRSMKADLHTHTIYSGYSTLPYLSRLLRESYNTPEPVYRLAKARRLHRGPAADEPGRRGTRIVNGGRLVGMRGA